MDPNVHSFVEYETQISDRRHAPKTLQKAMDCSEPCQSEYHENYVVVRHDGQRKMNSLQSCRHVCGLFRSEGC